MGQKQKYLAKCVGKISVVGSTFKIKKDKRIILRVLNTKMRDKFGFLD